MWTAEVLRTDMTYRQSPLLFCGLYDFFALWSASLVPSAAQLPNYNVTVHNSKTRTPKKQRPRAPKKCTAHGLAVIHSFRPCFGEGGGGEGDNFDARSTVP